MSAINVYEIEVTEVDYINFIFKTNSRRARNYLSRLIEYQQCKFVQEKKQEKGEIWGPNDR